MRVVFAGTPEFAVPCLQAVIDHEEVELVGVLTKPDQPQGRGKKISFSPIKSYLANHQPQIPIHQPRNSRELDFLKAIKPDLIVVVAYGVIIPQNILSIPPLGCVNAHASLLPRWRGASPIQRAIEFGDLKTGVCLIQMTSKLDAGPVLAKKEVACENTDTSSSLSGKLSQVAASLISKNMTLILTKELLPIEQTEQQATYAKKIQKIEGRINWRQSAADIERKIRAFNPYPLVFSKLKGDTILIWRASVTKEPIEDGTFKPGEVTAIAKSGVAVQTGEGRLVIKTIQRPGRRPLATQDFLNGFKLSVGDVFE